MSLGSYEDEQEILAKLCSGYADAWVIGDEFQMALFTGMIAGQCATIYRMKEPGGLVEIEAVFREMALHLLGARGLQPVRSVIEASENLDPILRQRILSYIDG